MVVSGVITSVRREGIDKTIGPLAKCAFEKVLDNFTNAALFGEREDINSISSSIIMGKLSNIGTGFMDIVPNTSKYLQQVGTKQLEEKFDNISLRDRQTFDDKLKDTY